MVLAPLQDPVLTVYDQLQSELLASSATERTPKLARLALNRRAKHAAETGALEQPTGAKRMKTAGLDSNRNPSRTQVEDISNHMPAIQDIMSRIEASLEQAKSKLIVQGLCQT